MKSLINNMIQTTAFADESDSHDTMTNTEPK